ncbi:hypothetical protein CEXT_336731 [Caerostris extrusa]|uniref:Uncharacterized protein n=1 Tax=Caerostris extrusa TaxID=172846 RepID=A0AAV4XPT3_CAEEX|nr:hypothetical protein CEXT_336731 [Caerostris extrusa]
MVGLFSSINTGKLPRKAYIPPVLNFRIKTTVGQSRGLYMYVDISKEAAVVAASALLFLINIFKKFKVFGLPVQLGSQLEVITTIAELKATCTSCDSFILWSEQIKLKTYH